MKEVPRPAEGDGLSAKQRYRVEDSYQRDVGKARDSFAPWTEPLRDLREQRLALMGRRNADGVELARLDAAIEEMTAKRDASLEQYLKPHARERLTPLSDADAAKFEAEVQTNLAKLRQDPRLEGFFPPTYDPFHGRTPAQYLRHFAKGRAAHGGIEWEHDREAPNGGIHWQNEVPQTLQAGERYARFSRDVRPAKDEGTYLTMAGTDFEAVGLRPDSLAQYQEYAVRRPIHGLRSEVQPGSYNTRGRGGQIKLELPVSWYVEHGYLEPVGAPYGR